ncbi:hypothetical protein D3C78_1668680 [compost metagenome]
MTPEAAAAHALIHDHHIDGGAAFSEKRRHGGADDASVLKGDKTLAQGKDQRPVFLPLRPAGLTGKFNGRVEVVRLKNLDIDQARLHAGTPFFLTLH